MTTPRSSTRPDDAAGPPRSAERSTRVAAPPELVWDLVSDLPGMGRFSPEATGGRWVRGDGPAVGSVFVGSNANAGRRWSTRSTVVRSEPGRAFAFETAVAGQSASRWTYEIAPDGDGCVVTERWDDLRSRLLVLVGAWWTKRADRAEWTAQNLEQTLAAVRAEAERRAAA